MPTFKTGDKLEARGYTWVCLHGHTFKFIRKLSVTDLLVLQNLWLKNGLELPKTFSEHKAFCIVYCKGFPEPQLLAETLGYKGKGYVVAPVEQLKKVKNDQEA